MSDRPQKSPAGDRSRKNAIALLAAGSWPVWDDGELEKTLEQLKTTKEKDRPLKRRDSVPVLADAVAPVKLEDDADWLPPALKAAVRTWQPAIDAIRASTGTRAPASIVADDRFARQPVSMADFATPAETAYMRMKQVEPAVTMREPPVSLTLLNEHLYISETMRWIIAVLTYLQREPEKHDAHTNRPWTQIYPQVDGKPIISPTGRYIVKLFWMGAWRRVLVDDRVPVNEEGCILLPLSSFSHELWPLLITKALCRVLAPIYESSLDRPEVGEASIVHILTGWMPETTALQQNCYQSQLVALLEKHCRVPSQGLVESPATSPKLFSSMGGTRLSPPGSAPSSAPSSPRPSRAIPTIALPVQDYSGVSYREVGLLQRLGIREGRNEGGASFRGARTPAHRPAALSNAPMLAIPDGIERVNRNALVFAVYRSSAPTTNIDVGIPPSVSHPVRVLSCVHIPTLMADIDGNPAPNGAARRHLEDWVLELESPFVLFKGPLGYMCPDDAGAARVQYALAVSLEREAAVQAHALACRLARAPCAPFRFRMYLSDFVRIFSAVEVYHKDTNFSHHSTIVGTAGAAPLYLESGGAAGGRPAEDKHQGMDLSAGQPWLLYVNSTHSAEMLLSFAVAPDSTARPADEQTREGNLNLEEFRWQSSASTKSWLYVKTTSARHVRFSLPAGRHVLRLLVSCPRVYALTVWSNKNFVLAEETAVLAELGGCSARSLGQAKLMLRFLGALMHKTYDDTVQMIDKLAAAHAEYNIPAHALAAFWVVLGPCLEDFYRGRFTPAAVAVKKPDIDAMIMELLSACNRAYRRQPQAQSPSRRQTVDMAAPVLGGAVRKRRHGMGVVPAAIIIQRHVRGFLARCTAQQLRRERSVRWHTVMRPAWELVSANTDELGRMVLQRLFDRNPDVAVMFPSGDDEQNRCSVLDLYARTEALPAQDYTVLFKNSFSVAVRTVVNFRLHVSQGEEPQATFCLHIIDNDSGIELPSDASRTVVIATIHPNRTGYTILADGTTQVALPATPFGLRILSNPELPPFDRPAPNPASESKSDRDKQAAAAAAATAASTHVLGVAVPCQEYEGPLVVSRGDELFRYVITPSTRSQTATIAVVLRPTLDAAPAMLRVDLLVDGRATQTAIGKGKAVVPLAFLFAKTPPGEEAPLFQLVGRRIDAENKEKPLSAASTASERLGPVVRGASLRPNRGMGKAVMPPRSSTTLMGSSQKDKAPTWMLRIYSTETLTVVPDHLRDTEITATKAAWFALPGRRARGTELRKKHSETQAASANTIMAQRLSFAQTPLPGLIISPASPYPPEPFLTPSPRSPNLLSASPISESAMTSTPPYVVLTRELREQQERAREEYLAECAAVRSRQQNERQLSLDTWRQERRERCAALVNLQSSKLAAQQQQSSRRGMLGKQFGGP
eukprot:m.139634 g.139634  ORF g.139634 m.139634 type:complete len:1418 (-) comp9618_c0_seq2:233-4486(-)